MTAVARSETSGKHKKSTSSKAPKATLAAHSADIAEHEEHVDTEPEDLTEHEEPGEEDFAAHAASRTEPAPAAVTHSGPAYCDPRDDKPRFRIFIVDSGWNHPAGKVLRENFDLIHALTHEDPIYVLSHDDSIAMLCRKKALIGHDPIISVHDLKATGKRGPKDVHGFRLHLGLLDTEEQVLAALKSFARFIGTHRDAPDLDASVRRKLHKQGIAGAFEIVGGAATALMMEP